jgi:integrase
LLAAGGSLYDVKELLGHADYNLTANLYAHFMDEQRRATADRVQQALGDAIVASLR